MAVVEPLIFFPPFPHQNPLSAGLQGTCLTVSMRGTGVFGLQGDIRVGLLRELL